MSDKKNIRKIQIEHAYSLRHGEIGRSFKSLPLETWKRETGLGAVGGSGRYLGSPSPVLSALVAHWHNLRILKKKTKLMLCSHPLRFRFNWLGLWSGCWNFLNLPFGFNMKSRLRTTGLEKKTGLKLRRRVPGFHSTSKPNFFHLQ